MRSAVPKKDKSRKSPARAAAGNTPDSSTVVLRTALHRKFLQLDGGALDRVG